MSTTLSPLVSLATSMHAQPGVYAVLLGSGVSTAAGIPTGWGVVRELVRRIAAADGGDSSAVDTAWGDPEAWWAENAEGKLGYSTLLEQLAPTAAARQGLLADFFEPDEDEREEGLKQPTKAHESLAKLVKNGLVGVIITTNFDRLMERALEAQGVTPQVIARPEAVNGMAPLVHSPATIIKLHGDYKDLGSRNTPDELNSYPAEWNALLSQVFDEYGLIVSGWSADWDTALVSALERTPNRRYPLYWDARSSKGDNAQRLLAARSGTIVPASSADEFFSELAGDIDALDRLSAPPLSAALALARLKRYLADPVRRIDLHDLVMRQVDAVVEHIAASPINSDGPLQWQDLQDTYEGYFSSIEQLAPLLEAGVWHDPEGAHDQLWVDVLQRLVDAGTAVPSQGWNDALYPARLLPAFAALAICGMTAMRRDREGLLIRLATEVEGRPRPGEEHVFPAAHLLHYLRLTSDDWVNALPRWEGTRWTYPASHMFVTDLWRYFKETYPAFDDYRAAYHGFEYRLGLVQEQLTPNIFLRAISGEYVGERAWGFDGVPLVEATFRRQIDRSRSQPWSHFLGGTDQLNDVVERHREVISRYKRW
ncbi:SIR2 family protein [Paramicrobacterium fandaimingii]|uniref:SIR2 family protein n=1 Tax=Paramicrobacterium fandaimingii TaxID=2708079 RepID=UPI0014246E07|nr:SIR2 family protein [Microbacterium fandaimingii]